MSRYFDKDKLKEELTIEYIYDLLDYWGGEPEYSPKGLISQTICHNPPGVGSRKLYFYESSRLFACYTGCDGESSFDIFELCIKVMRIQKGLDWELYDAMDYIASHFGFDGIEGPDRDTNDLEDWSIIKRHKIPEARGQSTIQLREYNPEILTRFQYPRILPWEKEGITDEVIKRNQIGYYPGGEQITIPHRDIDGRLVGIRGRCLSTDDEKKGKYRPIVVNRQVFNHPLSLNLYNLNNSKENIKRAKIAIIFEGERFALVCLSL